MRLERKFLPQEGLKLIACITMLVDHVGAVIVPELSVPYMVELYYIFRAIGRVSFPIYAFLLAEGMRHTRNPQKYILRLGLGILLAELPFDFYLFEGWTWEHQSVMVTLTLGAMLLLCMEKTKTPALKPLFILLFGVAAELFKCDYGIWGILTVSVFALTENFSLQLLGILLINWLIPSLEISVLGLRFSIQLFGVLAMVPIALYSGRKLTHNRMVQRGFYLFYPVHLLILWLVFPIVR